jgi:hypothetical protein
VQEKDLPAGFSSFLQSLPGCAEVLKMKPGSLKVIISIAMILLGFNNAANLHQTQSNRDY